MYREQGQKRRAVCRRDLPLSDSPQISSHALIYAGPDLTGLEENGLASSPFVRLPPEPFGQAFKRGVLFALKRTRAVLVFLIAIAIMR